MSSNYRKRFTTTETTKAAGAEVVSDSIELSPRTKNHILTVTTDSSLSGTVDVEVEMSPDGNNWCPAVTTATTTSSSASTEARTGNEEYVKLTPDAGENKNKHCRGGLNFDVNGAVVTPDGSGARDLMHQHIATTKSFNYSQWFKTSEAPTTSYKPVLFRHGGYDDFSNTKVPQLTEATNSGTVPANTKVAKGTSNSGNSINNKDFVLSGTNSTDLPGFLPDIGNYQADYKRMPSLMEAWSFSWWVKLGEPGDNLNYSATSYYTGLWMMGRNASGFLKSHAYDGHIYAGIKQPNTDKIIMCTGQRTAGQWYHCVLTKSAGTGTPGYGNQTDQGELKFYIDGVLQGTESLGTTLSDNNFYTMQITEANILGSNPHPNNNYYRANGVAEIDEFSSYKDALHLDEIQALSNGGKPVDPTTIPVSGNKNIPSKICTYFKFGDASNDNSTTHVSFNQIDNSYRTANSRSTISTADPGTMTLETYNSRGTLHALDTSETIYNASSTTAQTKITQNLTSSVSTFSSQFTTINAGVSGQGSVRVTVGSDAATFYGSTGGTNSVDVTNGNENDIGKHLLGIYKPDVSFSSSRWILVNRYPRAAGWKNRSGYQHGYPGPNYTASNYIRFLNYINVSPFVTYSANSSSPKSLLIRPVITGSSGSYWYLYANSEGKVPITFTTAAGGTLTVPDIEAGFHCVTTYDPPSNPSQGIPASSVKVYINGVEVAIRTTTENGVEYVETAAPSDNLFYGDEVYAHDSAWGGAAYLDYGTGSKSTSRINNHMDFSNRVLTQSEAQTLYNGGSILDFSNMTSSFPISLTGCVGAYDSDVAFMNDTGSPSIKWGFKDCSGYGKHVLLYQGSITTNQAVQTTSSNYSPGWMALPTPLINQYFSASSNLSISGWFKTTDTGILFSNSEGAYTTGLKAEIISQGVRIYFRNATQTAFLATVSNTVNDGNWHNIIMVLEPGHSTKKQRLYIDGVEVATANATLLDITLRGNNGFTLLSDGQINANDNSPASSDPNKLNASISNWSIHSEALDVNAVLQIYSNGNIRNIKNLPNVDVAQIKAWWQLNDATNPQNNLIGTDHLRYIDGGGQTLVARSVNATDDALVQNAINGNAMTMSLTKSFNFTTKKWVSTADQDTALCLSFNGFEEQAEYFAVWKCSQTVGGKSIDICDGGWHNVILSYRGKNNLSGNNVDPGDVVKFGPGPNNNAPVAYNWALSFDGEPLTVINAGSGVDYIGGLNTLSTDVYNQIVYNVGFAIQDRHLKYISTNSEEVYKPHAQFGAGIYEQVGVDNNNAFQGSVDETSFHSDTWWVDQAGTTVLTTTYNAEKPATIYGNTTALAKRGGTSTDYPEGKPYDLLNPGRLTAGGQLTDIQGSNQFINPARYNASSNPNGGLEGWWRWGDTPGDCSLTINDVRDHTDQINARDITAFGIVTADRVDMDLAGAAESIYLEDRAATQGSSSSSTSFVQVKLEGIQQGICNLKNILSPLLQYVRVKIKGAGSVDLGEGKTEVSIYYTNRVRRRKN